MKIIVTVLSLLIVLASCQKEYTGEMGSESSTPGKTSGSFTAKINSVQWKADKGAGAVFSPEGNGLPRLLNISGLSYDKKIINITLVDSGVHQYTFGDDPFQVGLFIDSTLPNTYAFGTDQLNAEIAGTVNIISINTVTKTMSGTFSFKAYKDMDNTQVDITEGIFTDIPYIDGAILPPSNSTDTFHVKVNNLLFNPFSIGGMPLAFNHTITLQGADSAGLKTVALTIPDNITPGSYSMNSFNYFGLYNDGNSSLGSVSGTLQILEHNTTTKRIRGSFDFKAEDATDPNISANLSEGYFSIQYQ